MKLTIRRHQPAVTPAVTLSTAVDNATLLTEAEVRSRTTPAHQAVEAFRVGRGMYRHLLILCTCMHLGRAIESGGVVRGLLPLFELANGVLQSISDRMEHPTTRVWTPGALYPHELQTLRDLVHDHAFQLRQVSFGEYTKAYRLATARVQSSGGVVVGVEQTQALPTH